MISDINFFFGEQSNNVSTQHKKMFLKKNYDPLAEACRDASFLEIKAAVYESIIENNVPEAPKIMDALDNLFWYCNFITRFRPFIKQTGVPYLKIVESIDLIRNNQKLLLSSVFDEEYYEERDCKRIFCKLQFLNYYPEEWTRENLCCYVKFYHFHSQIRNKNGFQIDKVLEKIIRENLNVNNLFNNSHKEKDAMDIGNSEIDVICSTLAHLKLASSVSKSIPNNIYYNAIANIDINDIATSKANSNDTVNTISNTISNISSNSNVTVNTASNTISNIPSNSNDTGNSVSNDIFNIPSNSNDTGNTTSNTIPNISSTSNDTGNTSSNTISKISSNSNDTGNTSSNNISNISSNSNVTVNTASNIISNIFSNSNDTGNTALNTISNISANSNQLLTKLLPMLAPVLLTILNTCSNVVPNSSGLSNDGTDSKSIANVNTKPDYNTEENVASNSYIPNLENNGISNDVPHSNVVQNVNNSNDGSNPNNNNKNNIKNSNIKKTRKRKREELLSTKDDQNIEINLQDVSYLQSLKVVDLRHILEQKGLKKYGLKKELIKRILDSMDE